MPRLRTTDLLDAPVPAFSIPDQQQIGRACTILRVRAYSVEERFRQVLALSGIHREAVLRASDGANEFTRKETGSAELDGGALLAQLLDFRRRDWETEQIALSEKSGRALKGEDWKKKYPIPSPPPIDGLPQLPAGWVWASVEQLTLATSPLCYGVVQPGDESSEGVPMVRVNDLQNDAIRPGKLRRIAFDIDEAHARSRLKGGEVLVSIVGTIGRVAIVPPEMVGANIARAIAKLTVNPLMPSEWIANALMAPRLQFWMQSSSREVARKTLNLESLGKAAIAIPPASMINETLDLQEKHLERVRQTSNNVERTLQRLQYFRRNVVSRIFATNVRIPLFSTEWNAVIASFFESTTAQRTIVAEENKNSKAHRTSGRTSEMNENDLFSILLDHPEGLSPFDLLQRSRYATSTIESFYQELAGEVKKGRISEVRNGIREVKLLVNDDASR
nr:restriction endonuclease subunit S [Burkholderia sp. CpTa8-5]